MKTLKLSVVTLSFLTLFACSDSKDPDVTTPKGVFIDSPVEGLIFTTATQSGTTDSAGTFTYIPGEIVSFYIGDILIGSAEGQAMLTPLEFVPGAVDETDPEVTNILRFIQSMDSDNNPDNGITISAESAAAAIGENLDFSLATVDFEAAATALLATLNPGSTLVDESTAQAHFVESLGGTPPGSPVGTLSLSGADTSFIGTSTDPLLVTASPTFIQWRQDFPNSTFVEAAVAVSGGAIVDVLFTWQDTINVTSAAYAISCPANPFPFYPVGDCSAIVLDTTAQQVSFDVSITNVIGLATAPLTVTGVLDY